MNNALSLPLEAEQIWTILTNQNNDHSDSRIQVDCKISYDNLQSNLILYICNTQLQCDLVNVNNLSYEQKKDILEQYLKCPSIHYIPQLANEFLAIVSLTQSIDLDYDDQCIFDLEQRVKWVKDNITLSMQLTSFVMSALVYTARQTLINKSVIDDLKDTFEIADFNVPLNIVNVFLVDRLIDFWKHADIRLMRYFIDEFERPIFNGHHLSEFISQDFNIVYGLAILEASGKLNDVLSQ